MRNILTSLSKRRLRHQKSQQSHRSRRLLLEQLEDRRLLASLPTWEAQGPGPILSGQVEGTQHVRGQVIFLDFDGAREVTYRGPVTVGPFDIPAFVAPKNLAHRETDIVTSVVSSLNNNFAASGLVFTTQQPDTTLPFSTIFIGGSDDAFSAYGSFLGLAEQVDFGNQAPADNAFVFSESIMTTSFEVSAYAEDLSEVVAHEVGHLIGNAHDIPNLAGGPLASVAQFKFGADYRTVDQLYKKLDSIHAAHPSLTKVIDYGDSFCKGQANETCVIDIGGANKVSVAGSDLKAIKITNPAITGNKPALFLVAGVHPREIINPEMAMQFVVDLTSGYGQSADLTWIVDHQEIWVVPMANPDGYKLVEMDIPQRKNLNFSDAVGKPCDPKTKWPPDFFSQPGVDLNRNHSFKRGTGTGISFIPCDQDYVGVTSQASLAQQTSEPEVDALESQIKSVFKTKRGPGNDSDTTTAAAVTTPGMFVSLHSAGDLVIRPWSHTATATAPNEPALKKLGDKLAALHDTSSTFAKVGSPGGYISCRVIEANCLGPTTLGGDTSEFVYGVTGVPAFTFEVGQSFDPPFSEVQTHYDRNLPAFIQAAKLAREPYKLIEGPDVAGIVPSTSAGRTLQVSAKTVSVWGTDIATAEFYVDTPPWSPNAVAHTLFAADGTFDSPAEQLSASLDISKTPNAHVVFVRSQDVMGNWGPVSAEFLVERRHLASPPVWEAQGPGPILNGQVEGILQQQNPVAGAIHAVVAHPTDANSLFIGAVNGGIWRTNNAQSSQPKWEPLTDFQSSLSIASLEFDPTAVDPNNPNKPLTLVAGTGRVSSFFREGGDLTGLLYSTNSGTSWTPLGATDLAGVNIAAAAARGNVIHGQRAL